MKGKITGKFLFNMSSTKWCSLSQKGIVFRGKLKMVEKQKAVKLPE